MTEMLERVVFAICCLMLGLALCYLVLRIDENSSKPGPYKDITNITHYTDRPGTTSH